MLYLCRPKKDKKMKVFRGQRFMMKIEQIPLLVYLLKWIVLSAVSGACIGSASALLLVSLNWATDYRESHLWVLFLLPLAGLLIGLMYHYLAGTAARGRCPAKSTRQSLPR
jgi:H+/Cl- antiporter ClcA